MEREVKVPVKVQGPMGHISLEVLLDSRATGCFVNKKWAQEHRLWLLPLVKKVPVFNVDGTPNCAGEVTHKVKVNMKVGRHVKELWMFATNLGKVPIILGHTWLQKHNPDIDWITGRVVLNCCPKECSTSQKTALAKKLEKEEASEGWIQALKAWEEKQAEMKKDLVTNLKEAQKAIPKEYWKYIDVFSKKSSECMPL